MKQGEVTDDPPTEIGRALLESIALSLLSLGMDDHREKGFEMCRMGDLTHVRVTDAEGEVAFQVCGKTVDELGDQLMLACLHNLSIEHLGALHLKPLNRPLRVKK
ncbi:hypothetical protein [Geomesophilobacter sediminis]|uniref:Uncharacterized protein n=1 Tax=Geomesophilobacter sediminis TaxID=2798584 RepID=A0A8J7M140_9BACT|nr:hypothetical protein [Geomesophilobacter sediminis]MBJ6726676.1 hypothetical protein [Geomesophilobacter sediminis]